LSAVGMEYW